MSTRPVRTRQIIVGMHIDPDGVVPVGILLVEPSVTSNTDKSVGRFRYAPSYLLRLDAAPIDPAHLPLSPKEVRFARFGGLPGAVRDSSADSWGRSLIERYYRARGVTTPLSEVDYLLASPKDRAGNLHFATDFDESGAPRWDAGALQPEKLPEIKATTDYVVDVLRSPQVPPGKSYPKAMDCLLTGAGGARPKLTIQTPAGLYLLKLANQVTDRGSNARLEAASVEMARLAGIKTASMAVKPCVGDQDLLAVKRFDVDANGKRLQMVSAMTVLNAIDDPYGRENWSYPLLARELDRWSSHPAEDKAQLFRSMVLRAMLSDSDDHPRNYALLRNTDSQGGSTFGQWRLAPLYDCVVGLGKGTKATDLSMVIGKHGRQISEENILSECGAFGLTVDSARQIMKEIEAQVMGAFPAVMAKYKIDPTTQDCARGAVAALNDRPVDSAIARLMADVDERAAANPPAPTVERRVPRL